MFRREPGRHKKCRNFSTMRSPTKVRSQPTRTRTTQLGESNRVKMDIDPQELASPSDGPANEHEPLGLQPDYQEEDVHPEDEQEEPVLDWRTIARLRQQRDTSKALLSEIRELEEHVQHLKEQKRRERMTGKRQRKRTPVSSSSSGSEDEESYKPATPPSPVKKQKTPPKRGRPPNRVQGIPEDRQLAYIQLKRAIGGCLDRYHCTDKQRRAILYQYVDKINDRMK